MTRYITLGEYFWLAEQVTGVDAATLIHRSRVDLADSAMQAIAAGEVDETWVAGWLRERVRFPDGD